MEKMNHTDSIAKNSEDDHDILVEDEEMVPFHLESRRSRYFYQEGKKYLPAYIYPCYQPLLSYHTATLSQLLKPWTPIQNQSLLKNIQSVKNDLSQNIPKKSSSKPANEDDERLLTESSFFWEEVAKKGKHNLKKTAFDCYQQYTNQINPSINHSEWTVEEEQQLLQLVHQYQSRHWHIIAKELQTGRTPIACLRHYQQTLNHQLINSMEWTMEEDQLLKESVEKFGIGKWQHVAAQFKDRSAQQCLNRWRKSMTCQDSVVAGPWLEEEERALFLAAYAYDVPMLADSKKPFEDREKEEEEVMSVKQKIKKPLPNWIEVAKLVPGKNDVQCREKWNNNLDPTLNPDEFTRQEDAILEELVSQFGEGNWAKVATYVPGRTDAMVRARWKAIKSAGNSSSSQKKQRNKAKGEDSSNRKRKALPSKHMRSSKAKIQTSQLVPISTIQMEDADV